MFAEEAVALLILLSATATAVQHMCQPTNHSTTTAVQHMCQPTNHSTTTAVVRLPVKLVINQHPPKLSLQGPPSLVIPSFITGLCIKVIINSENEFILKQQRANCLKFLNYFLTSVF
jgi:hypothetical protein